MLLFGNIGRHISVKKITCSLKNVAVGKRFKNMLISAKVQMFAVLALFYQSWYYLPLLKIVVTKESNFLQSIIILINI